VIFYVSGMEVASQQIDGGDTDLADRIRLGGSDGSAYVLTGSSTAWVYKRYLNVTTVDTAFRSWE